jgi:membrane protein implicated in regulation of membrane protease activity
VAGAAPAFRRAVAKSFLTGAPRGHYVLRVADWVVWLVIAGGLLVAELFTLTFVLGLLAGAAVVTAAAAALDLPLAAQIGVFGVSSGIGYVLVRPFERMHQRTPALTTGTAALTGKRAVVSEAITSTSGRVTLGGETWAARALSPTLTYDVGTPVVVSAVDGATVVVSPEEL